LSQERLNETGSKKGKTLVGLRVPGVQERKENKEKGGNVNCGTEPTIYTVSGNANKQKKEVGGGEKTGCGQGWGAYWKKKLKRNERRKKTFQKYNLLWNMGKEEGQREKTHDTTGGEVVHEKAYDR